MSVSEGAATIYSDDFSEASINAVWDATQTPGTSSIGVEGFGTSDAWAVLTTDAGTTFSMYGALGGVLLAQASVTDANWTITAKFETLPSSTGMEWGIFTIDDVSTPSYGVTCGWYYDASLTQWASEFYTQGTNFRNTSGATETAPAWLRMSWDTSDNHYDFAWSDTGAFGGEEDTATSGTVGTVPAVVGIYAASFGGGSAPSSVAKCDYFFESSAIISPEDPTGGGPTRRIFVCS